MTKNWMFNYDGNGIRLIDLQITIPISVKLQNNPDITIGDWLIKNLCNVLYFSSGKVYVLVISDTDGEIKKHELKQFKPIDKINKIIGFLLSTTAKKLEKYHGSFF